MCNPRRIRVKATRQLQEAWQREISRTIDLQGQAIGEARVRQPLDANLGKPTLRALEAYLASDESGWAPTDEGFRHNVEGGYVLYLTSEQALELVATLEEVIHASGKVNRILEGTVTEEISVEGEGTYYDDGWWGKTKEKGEVEAKSNAQQKLDLETQIRVQQAQDTAEIQSQNSVKQEAEQQAKAKLQQKTLERQTFLANQARQHLETVGLRGRQIFHQALAQAYRNAILAYAKLHCAENIQCHEEGDVVEIEFNLQS